MSRRSRCVTYGTRSWYPIFLEWIIRAHFCFVCSLLYIGWDNIWCFHINLSLYVYRSKLLVLFLWPTGQHLAHTFFWKTMMITTVLLVLPMTMTVNDIFGHTIVTVIIQCVFYMHHCKITDFKSLFKLNFGLLFFDFDTIYHPDDYTILKI